MDFHYNPNSFIGGEKSDDLPLEAMRSWNIEEHKNGYFEKKEPEEDDVNKLDHDMFIINMQIEAAP